MSTLPIADYALISNCRSAALVSRGGSIDWLCFPRFDGPSVFARLLDEKGGHWSIRPVGDAEITRRYVEDTMLLETTFTTPTGAMTLVDALAVGRNERGHELGAGAPSVVLRRVRGIQGEVDVELDYAPRPEYGLIAPLLHQVDGGILARGGADVLALSAPMSIEVDDVVGRARFTVGADDTVAFALHHRSTSQETPEFWSQDEIVARLDDTALGWHTWSDLHQNYEGPWRDLVHHSGRVLYALTFYPTGAICAAPTTSLPETQGGSRNWDYRYAWVRDASFTLQALWVAACPDEADKFFDYLAGAAATQVRWGGRPADHVWPGRRARSDRTRAPSSQRLAQQRARPGRERGVEPAPARLAGVLRRLRPGLPRRGRRVAGRALGDDPPRRRLHRRQLAPA